ncbi:MAG: DUF4118 domain-containing protein [Herpetosiphon sp.]
MEQKQNRPGQDQRPDPDALLHRLGLDDAARKRGKLKIFFGLAAGVGKTYAMLDEARTLLAEGVDVVAGVVVTHGRAETEALLHGMEMLPTRTVLYRATELPEFDLDGALQRRPTVLLVDELAHTNVPGLRHPKRWQDVQELLDAGIDVYATVNVQHVESLNDVVAQITGIRIRETIPDAIMERADEVKLIDLPPATLLERLQEGKVYLPQQAEHAVRNFFRPGNLHALRELALRYTAERVDAQVRKYRQVHAIDRTWPVSERILVCVTSNPLSARLVRAGRRMAAGLRAEWTAVYVETPAHQRRSSAEREQVTDTLRLAEQLGAMTVVLQGQRASDEITRYARENNVTKIVAGKPIQSPWTERIFGSVVNDLVRSSGDVDVYVISGDPDEPRPAPRLLRRTSSWNAYAWAVYAVIASTTVAWVLPGRLDLSTLIMVYLLGVMFVAARTGRGPSILASLLSVLAFDFFFVPPYFTLAVADPQYLVTFVSMLLVAITISSLTTRLQQQASAAQRRERRTTTLYGLSRQLARTRGRDNLLRVAIQHLSDVVDGTIIVLVPNERGEMIVQANNQNYEPLASKEVAVARWVFDHGQRAGIGTGTLPGSQGLYLPLGVERGPVAVLGILPTDPSYVIMPEQLHLLETLANQTTLAIERAQLAEESERGRVEIETERLRNSLLSAVSHDLRTPLATITGASSSLMQDDERYDAATRHLLARQIYEESDRLNRLVSNLLDMTRLESGAMHITKNWYPIEEVVGAALTRLEEGLRDHPVKLSLPAELPLLPLDDVLMEQVLINVLENCIKYTAPGTPIEIKAEFTQGSVVIEVADRGPGLEPGSEARIFDKFYRVAHDAGSPGAGLGLAISKGIIAAHGGWIEARNRSGGGTAIVWSIPIDRAPPTVEAEPWAEAVEPGPAPDARSRS